LIVPPWPSTVPPELMVIADALMRMTPLLLTRSVAPLPIEDEPPRFSVPPATSTRMFVPLIEKPESGFASPVVSCTCAFDVVMVTVSPGAEPGTPFGCHVVGVFQSLIGPPVVVIV
jgi:hypothetical protein